MSLDVKTIAAPTGNGAGKQPASQWAIRAARLSPKEGWLTYFLLLVSLLVVVVTVDRAHWVDTPSLEGMMVWSTLIGLALSRIRINGIFLHLIALAIGAAYVYWQGTYLIDDGTFLERAKEMNLRFVEWWGAVRDGGISQDLMPFGVLIGAFAWITGYFSAWSIFRWHNAWGAIVPTAFGLVSNLSYLPDSYFSFLFLYFFFAALLLVRMHTFKQQQRWDRNQTEYPGHHGLSTIMDATAFAFLVFLIAAFLPARPAVSDTLRSAWIEGRQPMDGVESEFGRLLSQVPSRRDVPLKQFSANLPFQGPLINTDAVVFTVDSAFPTYWRSRAYAYYSPAGWVGEKTERHPLPWTPPLAQPTEYRSRIELRQRVTPSYPLSQLLLGSMPIESERSTVEEVLQPLTFSLPLRDANAPADLPADLRRTFTDLKAVTAAMSADQLSQAILRAVPEGSIVTEMVLADGRTDKEQSVDVKTESDEQYATALRRAIPRNQTFRLARVNIQRKQPYPADIVAVYSRSEVKAGETYVVTSMPSIATIAELNAARGAYPAWVTDRYLQLPDTVPQRVRQLAQQLTRTSGTPFEKATALENYLRTLRYDKTIVAPPPGTDGVDYFLFTTKGGYSDYFASAFVVMARSVGLPARMVVGYAPGTHDPLTNTYVVKDSDSHGWAEVYFPGYGWIEFEPTPGKGTIPRGLSEPSEGPDSESNDSTLVEEEPIFVPEMLLEQDVTPPDDPGVGRFTPLQSTILIITAMLVVAVLFLWLWYRQTFVRVTSAASVYDRMSRLGALAGMGPEWNQTPAEYAQSLGTRMPTLQEDVRLVAQAYARSQYGRKDISDAESGSILSAWRRIRTQLFRRVVRRR